MLRRIAATLAILVASFGIALTTPATVAAQPDVDCTETSVLPRPDIKPILHPPGGLVVVGHWYPSYVGDAFAGPGAVWRVWHVNYKSTSSPITTYSYAYAARCLPDGTKTSTIDLTETQPSSGPICGTADFTTPGGTGYQHIGSRSLLFGATYRYWATSATGGQFAFWSVDAARC